MGLENIDSDYLIDVIKNQFNMTIDIEGLIKQIDEDGSGEIEQSRDQNFFLINIIFSFFLVF